MTAYMAYPQLVNLGHKRNLPPSFLHPSTTTHPRTSSIENPRKTALYSWSPISVCCLVLAVSFISSLPALFFFPGYSQLHSHLQTLPEPLDFLASFFRELYSWRTKTSTLGSPSSSHNRKFTSPYTSCVHSCRNLSINRNA